MTRVLVTGGAGFIGSALVRELLEDGYEVIVYDNFLYGDKANLRGIEDDIEIVMGDILSWRFAEVLKQEKVEYVFHLAAEPYIPHCYDNPEKFIEVNIRGTFNVLFSCKLTDVKRIIVFSSSEVYGNAQSVPMDEKHPTLPLSSYATTKLAADRLCFNLYHEHDIPVVIIRPFNCYGPRETQPYVIPEIISQLSRSNKVRLGNIGSRRDFTYVHDTAKAAIAVMDSKIPNGEVVNIGSDVEYSIEYLANLVGEILGYKKIEVIVEEERCRKVDVDLLHCNSSKLRKLTSWEPKIDIKRGLTLTVDWYKQNRHKWVYETLLPPQATATKPQEG